MCVYLRGRRNGVGLANANWDISTTQAFPPMRKTTLHSTIFINDIVHLHVCIYTCMRVNMFI